MTTMLSYTTRPSHAGLLAFAAFCASITSAHAQTATAAATARAAPVEYSVVNLGPDAGNAVLNKNGQAAYATWSSGDVNIFNGFFDGKRVHVLGSLGGAYTLVRGLNNHGVVVGESRDALANDRAFTWTAARGMRALPGPSLSRANTINDAGQVVGAVRADGPPQLPYTRANRWDANGTLTRLGPAPARLSEARDINESGISVGDSEVQFQDSRAMVWDKAGKATDLGKFGGTQSTATHINASGQVLGTYYHREGRGVGFLWSQKQGMVRIGPDSGDQYVTALNDKGEVSGNNLVIGTDQTYRYTPFVWSAQRGMRPLPINGALDARV